jgi:hypothetical protein
LNMSTLISERGSGDTVTRAAALLISIDGAAAANEAAQRPLADAMAPKSRRIADPPSTCREP